MQVKMWRCGNCGYTVPITENLEGMDFMWYNDYASKLGCRSCGSYTINKANDGRFTAGQFLIVRSKLKFRGRS